MSYLNYVIAAYAIFAVVLGWDFIASHLQIRRELRNARRRAARQATAPGSAGRTIDPQSPGDLIQ